MAVVERPPSLPQLRTRAQAVLDFLQEVGASSASEARDKQWAEQSLTRVKAVPVFSLVEPRIALLGRAGAGKTTLANALLGYPLLPAESSGVAKTQTIVDVLVDASASHFNVTINFSSYENWHERRAEYARAMLKSMDKDPDDMEEPHLDTGDKIMNMLYGKSLDRTLLQQLLPVSARNSDPNSYVNAALSEQKRVLVLSSVAEVQSAVRHLVASPSAEELAADGVWLFPIVERVNISGNFSRGLLPSGVHLVDVPGVEDISIRRVRAARAAIETAGTVFVVASCANTAERPFTSAMVLDELSRLGRSGQSPVLVLSGAERFFDDPDGAQQKARHLADAKNITAPIVYCAANRLVVPNPPAHPTAYGVRELVTVINKEHTRALDRLQEVARQFDEAIRACEVELATEAPPQSPASNPLWIATRERLLEVAAAGTGEVRKKIDAFIAICANETKAIQVVQTKLHEWVENSQLHHGTMMAVLDRNGGPFYSSTAHGRIDLAESCILWILGKRRPIVTGWSTLFSDGVQTAIEDLSQAFRVQLRLAGATEQQQQAATRLSATLREMSSQRQRDVESRLVDRFRPVFTRLAQAAVKPNGRKDKGSGVVERVRERFVAYLDANVNAMYASAVTALKELLDQDAKLLDEECVRQTEGVLATLVAQERSTKVAKSSAFLESFRNVASHVESLVPLSPRGGAGECQVSFDGTVSGRVQGCVCKEPKVCMRCYLHLLDSRNEQRCPYCRGIYDFAIGYREGDFSIHVNPLLQALQKVRISDLLETGALEIGQKVFHNSHVGTVTAVTAGQVLVKNAKGEVSSLEVFAHAAGAAAWYEVCEGRSGRKLLATCENLARRSVLQKLWSNEHVWEVEVLFPEGKLEVFQVRMDGPPAAGDQLRRDFGDSVIVVHEKKREIVAEVAQRGSRISGPNQTVMQRSGTLGFICRDTNNVHYAVTAHHVLEQLGCVEPGEGWRLRAFPEVSGLLFGGAPVGEGLKTDRGRDVSWLTVQQGLALCSIPDLDCRLPPITRHNIDCNPYDSWQIDWPEIALRAKQTNLRVIKLGATTLVTEGKLLAAYATQRISASDYRHVVRIAWNEGTTFAESGDSGALYLLELDQKFIPLAIHFGSEGEVSYGVRLDDVFLVAPQKSTCFCSPGCPRNAAAAAVPLPAAVAPFLPIAAGTRLSEVTPLSDSVALSDSDAASPINPLSASSDFSSQSDIGSPVASLSPAAAANPLVVLAALTVLVPPVTALPVATAGATYPIAPKSP